MQHNRITQEHAGHGASAAGDVDARAPQKQFAVIADYDSPEELIAAAARVRNAGYTKWDSLSPFPVHGIEEAMGIKPTILPWLTLTLGLTGMTVGLVLQWWANSVAYPYLISGKPMFSLPANIPVTFELTILFAAYTTFFAMLGINLLPELFNPLLRSKRMPRYTSTKFAIVIEAKDPIFDRDRALGLLRETGGREPEVIMGPAQRAPLPRPLLGAMLITGSVLLVPPAFIAKARFTKTEKPRVHLVADMDSQYSFKAQERNAVLAGLFGDPRASLKPPAGTLARGALIENVAYATGKLADGSFATGLPAEVELSQALLDRGQQRFQIYCTPCHGITGDGKGLVSLRALALAESQSASGRTTGMVWANPAVFADPRIVAQPIGQIFNTLSYGLNNMKGYAAQITRDDRWAIASYVRALQKSQTATLSELSAEQRAQLEQAQ